MSTMSITEKFNTVLKKHSSAVHNHEGTDKTTTHSYGPVYERIIQELEGRDNLKILEIGIMSGAFIQVLHELFPDAEIYGIDVSLSAYKYPKNNPKIHLYEMDGTRKETAESVDQVFDLIIEDGSHLVEHQKKTLDVFAPYLKNNGIYITEDIVQGNEKLKTDLQLIGSKHNLKMQWIDLTYKKHRYDDIVAVFTKN